MKKEKRFEIIECGGTAFDIGKQYGAACRDSFITSIDAMYATFGHPCEYEYEEYKL